MADEPVKAPETKPDFNIEDLHKEIDAANKKLVSDEVSTLIAKEREAARKEAEKEFLVNQKLKEKEQELENFKKAQLEKERQASEQLEMLRRKVDELASSKAPINVQNPFNSPSQPKDTKPAVLNMTEEELEVVEKASFHALLDRKRA